MGLLSGSASVTRFAVTARPPEPDFDSAAFHAIAPGSEVRESIGFVPFELGAPYQVGNARWAFRVRIDRLRPDPTAVGERVKQLLAAEMEATGAPFVGRDKRRRLKELAEEELIVHAAPRSKIVEGALDGDVLYLGTTAKNAVGLVTGLLRRIGVTGEPKAPWLDRAEPEVASEVVPLRDAGQSVLGCRFLAALAGETDLFFEPIAGSVRLLAGETKVSLAGVVLADLLAYLERGAEVLAGKLTTGEVTFRLDGASWRIGGLAVETGRHDHWTELLDERLEKIAAVYELLDAKYAQLDPLAQGAPVPAEAGRPEVAVH
ncbi:MAG TPA: hypothetical protein VHM02_14855 [Thermoanaerobaculia bacterium]|nr:hypothetical protein [Thermoanaerobaculia bacterium]